MKKVVNELEELIKDIFRDMQDKKYLRNVLEKYADKLEKYADKKYKEK